MIKYVIVPIVEGYGEWDAVPILLQRWLHSRRYHNIEVHEDGPVRASGRGAITVAHDEKNELGMEYYIEKALLREPQPDAILILLDADEDCPRELAASLLARARALVPPDYPIGVVIAKREYEAWFLAAFPSTRFRQALTVLGTRLNFRLARQSLPRGMDVEEIADCKKEVAKLLGLKKYKETLHQPALTQLLPFTRGATRGMTQRSRSFRKLLKELHELLVRARQRRYLSEREQKLRNSIPPDKRPLSKNSIILHEKKGGIRYRARRDRGPDGRDARPAPPAGTSNPAPRTSPRSSSVTCPQDSSTFRANRIKASSFGSTDVPSRLSRSCSAVNPTMRHPSSFWSDG